MALVELASLGRGVVQNRVGDVQANVSVGLTELDGTTIVTVYEDNDVESDTITPFTDQYGEIQGWAEEGSKLLWVAGRDEPLRVELVNAERLLSVVSESDIPRQVKRAAAIVPSVDMVPRLVSGEWLFDMQVNGFTVQEHPNAAAGAKVDSDISMIVENVPSGSRTTFEAVRYPGYARVADGSIVTAADSLAATGVTVSVRAEFRRMSRRVIRKRIYLSADVATTVRITDGIMGDTTAMGEVAWDDTNTGGGDHASHILIGAYLNIGGATGIATGGYGIGVVDGYLARRQPGPGCDAILGPTNVPGGMRLLVGDNEAGMPALPVGTTETYVDLFYWAATWSSAYQRHREVAMCVADAMDIPPGDDDLMRLAAVCPRAAKQVIAQGSATPSLSYFTGFGRTFVRDSFWAQLAIDDHPFSAALLNRFAANLNGSNVVPEWIQDDGTIQYRTPSDNNALALLWAYWLATRAIAGSNSAAINGITDTQRNNIIGQLIAKDDGNGDLVFTRASDGVSFGHYDWYTVPASFTTFSSPHTTGYYACALIAAKRMGYAPGDIDTRIAEATAAYRSYYDATLGHLRFLKNVSDGTYKTYGSLLDLLPEWHAVFMLGTELLGEAIAVPTIEYFLSNHMVELDAGGRALRNMMQHGGDNFITPAEIGAGTPEGIYTNGGSQMPFDFMIASLALHYGIDGARDFWADRKQAEVNLEFDLHEAITLANPSPDPTTNPYNGRNPSRNMAWHGVMAAFERATGLA